MLESSAGEVLEAAAAVVEPRMRANLKDGLSNKIDNMVADKFYGFFSLESENSLEVSTRSAGFYAKCVVQALGPAFITRVGKALGRHAFEASCCSVLFFTRVCDPTAR